MNIGAPQTATRESPAARATHVRWVIIGMLAVISGTTYMDRLNLGIAAKYIQDEFAFSNQTMGWILSAFVLGYALFQVPGGWAGDKIGPRRMLTFAIVWWSVFTALTALAPQLPLAGWFGVGWSFAIVRFLIGMGESATYPNSAKIVSYWSAAGGRGVATSIFIAGLGVGGAVSPLGITWVMLHWGWRASFFICGALGGIVALVWHLYARDHPEEHRGVNAEELKVIYRDQEAGGVAAGRKSNSKAPVPWRAMLRSRSVWALVLSYFFHRISCLYLLHMVLHLSHPGPRAQCGANRTVGVHALHRHYSVVASWGMAFRPAGGQGRCPERAPLRHLGRRRVLSHHAAGGRIRGQQHAGHPAAGGRLRL